MATYTELLSIATGGTLRITLSVAANNAIDLLAGAA
jgi:hypothetical protein